MIEKKQCNQQSSVAYKSCIDSYYRSKDRNDIYEYWLYLQEAKRFCEAAGVLLKRNHSKQYGIYIQKFTNIIKKNNYEQLRRFIRIC